jgi:hypothetical protein
MKLTGINSNFAQANADALAVVVFKNDKASTAALKDLDKLTGGLIAAVMKAEEFKGEAGETALLRFAAKGRERPRGSCSSGSVKIRIQAVGCSGGLGYRNPFSSQTKPQKLCSAAAM